MSLYIETGKFKIKAALFRRAAANILEQYQGSARVSLGALYLMPANDLDYYAFDLDGPIEDGGKQFICKKHPDLRGGKISELEIDLPDSEPEPGLAGTYKVARAAPVRKTNGVYILLDLQR